MDVPSRGLSVFVALESRNRLSLEAHEDSNNSADDAEEEKDEDDDDEDDEDEEDEWVDLEEAAVDDEAIVSGFES